MTTTHRIPFDNAFDATRYSLSMEIMGATDITIALQDNEYIVEYTIATKILNELMETI